MAARSFTGQLVYKIILDLKSNQIGTDLSTFITTQQSHRYNQRIHWNLNVYKTKTKSH